MRGGAQVPGVNMVFDADLAEKLREKVEAAADSGSKSFTFFEHELDTRYAAYVLEWLHMKALLKEDPRKLRERISGY